MFRSQSVVFGLLNLVLLYCITGQLHAEKEFTFLLIVTYLSCLQRSYSVNFNEFARFRENFGSKSKHDQILLKLLPTSSKIVRL